MNGMYIRLIYTYHIYLKSLVNKHAVSNGHAHFQSELPRPIPRNFWNQTTDVHRGSILITRMIT